ncbi:MAG TPA: polysaccharide pyruvyl transferase family protein [Allocoleopsis sp.]
MPPDPTHQIDTSTPEKIKAFLHNALGKIGSFEQCAFLDYPDYFNLGDHLIGIATLFYLTDVVKANVNYVATINNFSEESLEKHIGQAPIILQGGGNLGDLWSHHQEFREYIISKYRDRPIIIMPQCIYFANPENLTRAAAIFNAHPNLTLFTRDNYSYELACQHFSNCQVIKAPDMAFHLVDVPLPSYYFNPKKPILYLCREDVELNQPFLPDALEIPNLVVKDWVNTADWVYRGRGRFEELKEWYWLVPGSILLFREGWQRGGFANPKEWLLRYKWEHTHPYAERFNTLYAPFTYRFSWSLTHTGMYQFLQSSLVITNRLHGHILSTLLGIPNILLPNSYYKNESFYKTWTHQIPYCRFITDPSQVKGTVRELLSSFSPLPKSSVRGDKKCH